ncbi:unnamed protein product [Mesocestoides corti]|uniref:Uncharacterized protein n=1 Tax=Mesocestoides corti TaxID=53468 RepID=A0A0R3UJK5_MESCO|nr:unnamed protein product [Mesocestoides corti]
MLFQSRQYARSLRVYKLGIRCLEGSASVSPAAFESRHEASANARQLYLTLLTNAALCLLKINISPEGIAPTAGKAPISTSGLMRPCIALCKKALQLDPQNAKAWYRMGQAYAALEDYHEAISAGERAVEALSVSKTSSVKVEEAIAKWRQALVSLNRAEHAHIRSAFLRRATKLRQQGLLFPDDDAGEANRLRFGDWSNDMASDVMSIHEELEAFGERMPDARSVVSRNSRKGGKRGGSCGLTTIDSEDEEEEEDEWGSTK